MKLEHWGSRLTIGFKSGSLQAAIAGYPLKGMRCVGFEGRGRGDVG